MDRSRRRLRLGLGLKLAILLLIATAVVQAVAMTVTFRSTRAVILRLAQERATALAEGTAAKLEQSFKPVDVATLNLAANVESIQYEVAELEQLLRNVVSSGEDVYGSAIAFEPYAFDPALRFFSPYAYEETPSRISVIRLGGADYDYFEHDWYRVPRQQQRPSWSEPYVDPAVKRLMCTYSVPIFRNVGGTRTFHGVVTADVTIDQVVELVSRIRLHGRGHAFLLSAKGTFLSHPRKALVLQENVSSIAGKYADPRLAAVGKAMTAGRSGAARLQRYLDLGPTWIFYAPVEHGWSVGVVIPERELFAQLNEFTRRYVYISAIVFALMLLVIMMITQRVTVPLKSLAGRSREIAKGNLDLSIPMTGTTDEVGDLATAFENMRVSLKDYIRNLEETTAAKSRYESELKIAANIQMSFLPRTFPPFPDREEFDLHAFLVPAKEVGGDLYDFFFPEPDRLYFLVGDVSDKGVPAALFMAATKTLMRGFAGAGTAPSAVMNRVNRELNLFNEQMMFVTVFCGSLDVTTGALLYANAGHNPPVLVRDGTAKLIETESGFVMGVDPEFVYSTQQMTVSPGDVLIVYSDGVTEAMNAQKELYSEERLLRVAAESAALPAAEIIEQIRTDVLAHAAAFPQSDDITILVIKYMGPASPEA